MEDTREMCIIITATFVLLVYVELCVCVCRVGWYVCVICLDALMKCFSFYEEMGQRLCTNTACLFSWFYRWERGGEDKAFSHANANTTFPTI